MFTTELSPGDTIIIAGEEFLINQINNDTSLIVTNSPTMTLTDETFVSPMVTRAPDRDEYVVFSSIGVLLT